MTTKLKMTLIAGLAALAVACGGDGEGSEVLHMRGFDATEDQWRTYIRLESVTPLNCQTVKGLSAQELLALIDASEGDGEDVTDEEAQRFGFVLAPDQKADDRSRNRGAEIIVEECERLTS